jgi:hypothetical protein
MSNLQVFVISLFLALALGLRAAWYNRREAKKALQHRIATAGQRFDLYDKRALSEVSADELNLQAGEVCYYRCNASLYGYKTVRGTMAYHGPVI